MERYNREIFTNYKPSQKTFETALKLTEKLGKLSTMMQAIFEDYRIPSKLFSFIESKFSSRIEGIYTTLFDVINTGKEIKQEKIIRPLVDSLLNEDSIINKKKIDLLAEMLNNDKNNKERYTSKFGIWNNKKKIKVYEPLLVKSEIEKELEIFWTLIFVF